jgi:hypothetical protein
MQRKRQAINFVLLVLGFIIPFEIGSYALLSLFAERFRVKQSVVRRSTSDELVAMENSFDSQLGWLTKFETSYGQRPGGDDGIDTTSKNSVRGVAVFGDSFVYGGELGVDQTLAKHLKNFIDRPVLNFGQPAFGTDQALLFFERKAPEVKGVASTVVLGLTAENLNRIVSAYRPCYSVATRYRFPKPYFKLIDGRLELHQNPLSSFGAFQSWEEGVVSGGGLPGDHWCQTATGPSASFPYTFGILNKNFLNVLLSNPGKVAAATWGDTRNQELLTAILDRYRKVAQHHRMQAVLMLLDATYAVNEAQQFFDRYCSMTQAVCINTYRCLVNKPDANRRSISLLPEGHFDAETVRRAAECTSEELLPFLGSQHDAGYLARVVPKR